jgi:SOS response regulatory protein OraA/RecX
MAARRASALDAALRLLAGKDYSRPELLAKLAQRRYAPAEIEQALATLERYGYTMSTGDDRGQLERLASAYLARRASGRLATIARALEAYLLKKGFDTDLVEAYVREFCERRMSFPH